MSQANWPATDVPYWPDVLNVRNSVVAVIVGLLCLLGPTVWRRLRG